MPYVHRLRRLVRGRYASSSFYTEKQAIRAGALDIPRYHQLDAHSCGFLAGLAVVRYFGLETPVDDVLAAFMPAPSRGCDQKQMIGALKRLGVTATYQEWLGWPQIARELTERRPVIVSIEPWWYDWDEGGWAGYESDHWTVIRGLQAKRRRVLLTNYAEAEKDCGLTWAEFRRFRRYSDETCGGLLCSTR